MSRFYFLFYVIIKSMAHEPKYLMKEHGFRQKDLTEIGSPGVISEVLSGKRELNRRQIKALSERFGCSPAIFI